MKPTVALLCLLALGCAHEPPPGTLITTEMCMQYRWNKRQHRWACTTKGKAEFPQSMMGGAP